MDPKTVLCSVLPKIAATRPLLLIREYMPARTKIRTYNIKVEVGIHQHWAMELKTLTNITQTDFLSSEPLVTL